MTPNADPMTEIIDLVRSVRRDDRRTVVAIAGPPGSGKSTLATDLVEALSRRYGSGKVALMPMDGFHLDNEVLEARGMANIKGAPQTFDAKGFISLVSNIRCKEGDLSYPLFDRPLDKTVPDGGCLAADAQIIVVEGNYLLLETGAWPALREMFDATIMLSAPVEVLRRRLVARWLEFGLPKDAAVARADGNDMVNARTVIENSAVADLTIELSGLRTKTETIQQEGLQC